MARYGKSFAHSTKQAAKEPAKELAKEPAKELAIAPSYQTKPNQPFVVVVGGSDEPGEETSPGWVAFLREKASEVAKPDAAVDYVERIVLSVELGLTPRQAAAPLAGTISNGKVRDLTAYLASVANRFERKYDPQILTREIE